MWWEGLWFKQTNVTGCCSIIVLTEGCLAREISSLNPNQAVRGGSEGSLCTSVLFSLYTVDISVSAVSNVQLNHVPCRRPNESVKMRSAS